MKRGLLFVYGPAELDTARDPVQNLDREHDDVPKPAPEKAKAWDRG